MALDKPSSTQTHSPMDKNLLPRQVVAQNVGLALNPMESRDQDHLQTPPSFIGMATCEPSSPPTQEPEGQEFATKASSNADRPHLISPSSPHPFDEMALDKPSSSQTHSPMGQESAPKASSSTEFRPCYSLYPMESRDQDHLYLPPSMTWHWVNHRPQERKYPGDKNVPGIQMLTPIGLASQTFLDRHNRQVPCRCFLMT